VRQLPSSNKQTSCQLASSNRRTSCIFLLPLSNVKCQVLSSNKRTFFFYHYHVSNSKFQQTNILHLPFYYYQVASSNKRTILQLPYSFLICVIPRVSGQVVSPKSFVFTKISLQTGTIVDNHFSQWTYIIPKRSRTPFPQQIWVSRCCFSFLSNILCRPAFIIASQALQIVLGAKLVYFRI